MKEKLLFGITESGIMHTDEDPNISLENKFQMVKSSGVYDYLDKTPLKEDIKFFDRAYLIGDRICNDLTL